MCAVGGNAYGTKLERLYRLVNGKAEALEFIPKGTDPYIGIPLRKLNIRPGTLVAVIVRQGQGDRAFRQRPHRSRRPCGGDCL